MQHRGPQMCPGLNPPRTCPGPLHLQQSRERWHDPLREGARKGAGEDEAVHVVVGEEERAVAVEADEEALRSQSSMFPIPVNYPHWRAAVLLARRAHQPTSNR